MTTIDVPVHARRAGKTRLEGKPAPRWHSFGKSGMHTDYTRYTDAKNITDTEERTNIRTGKQEQRMCFPPWASVTLRLQPSS